ncbi:hypothetical protein JK636_22585 [Clostridium sp. YIM B02515]|uniref:Uncharacterized protein n=1 Tax=Clostridium rhizosphaerae TaxID=2803861 RepID=A0ABS1TGQ4_9CLOT|nr:hypothetical protein [Clostridium rhizosphaerae]MBL4938495.1 hypothetical protein [Clostridium rhizosphaerae]
MYPVSYTYIEYLDKTYGMEKILKLIKTEDYSQAFGKTEKEIYEDWVTFFKSSYLE